MILSLHLAPKSNTHLLIYEYVSDMAIEMRYYAYFKDYLAEVLFSYHFD